LPIVPMELVALEHGSEWEPMATLAPDGTILQGRRKPIGAIGGDQLFDGSRRSVMWCAPDGTVRAPGASQPIARFDAQDRLLDAHDGSVMWIDDNGFVHRERGVDPFRGSVRFVGGYASAKRTAIVVFLSTFMNARWSF
jgi:hypothetical protein